MQMQKGKLGFSLWLYPFFALWGVSTRLFWVPFLIAAIVLLVEKEEWTIKQCLHTLVLTLLYSTYTLIMTPLTQIPVSTDIGAFMNTGEAPTQWGIVFSRIDLIASAGIFVLFLFMGMLRLIKGEGIALWGMSLVNRAYGLVQQTVPTTGQQPYPTSNNPIFVTPDLRNYPSPPVASPNGDFTPPAVPQNGGFTPPPAPNSGGFTPPPAPPSGTFTPPAAPPSGTFTPPAAPPSGTFTPPAAPPTGGFTPPPAPPQI